MSVKFRMCDRCKKVKKDPLSRNYISPGERFCPSCKSAMMEEFIRVNGYDIDEIFSMSMGDAKCHRR